MLGLDRTAVAVVPVFMEEVAGAAGGRRARVGLAAGARVL